MSKRRTSLRLLSELYMSGVHDDLGAITGLVKVLVKTYFTGSKDSAQAALTAARSTDRRDRAALPMAI